MSKELTQYEVERYEELYDRALHKYLDYADIHIMDYVDDLLDETQAEELKRLDKKMTII